MVYTRADVRFISDSLVEKIYSIKPLITFGMNVDSVYHVFYQYHMLWFGIATPAYGCLVKQPLVFDKPLSYVFDAHFFLKHLKCKRLNKIFVNYPQHYLTYSGIPRRLQPLKVVKSFGFNPYPNDRQYMVDNIDNWVIKYDTRGASVPPYQLIPYFRRNISQVFPIKYCLTQKYAILENEWIKLWWLRK